MTVVCAFEGEFSVQEPPDCCPACKGRWIDREINVRKDEYDLWFVQMVRRKYECGAEIKGRWLNKYVHAHGRDEWKLYASSGCGKKIDELLK